MSMMREVTGAFRGSRKLAEALDDLRAEGIGSDRIRVDGEAGSLVMHVRDPGVALHWMTAEYAGHGEHLGVVDSHDYLFDSDFTDEGMLSSFARDEADDCDFTRVVVGVVDDVEMRSVCDIFSRLGTADVDAEGVVA
jgi:hypothetical protein